MAKVLGIDLGTTNSLVAVMRGLEPEVLPDEQGRAILPSIVHYGADGTVHVALGKKSFGLAGSLLTQSTVVLGPKALP